MSDVERRPRRRAAAKSKLGQGGLPSAVHYVGYVEDGETPEMIMKKFEALERVQEAAKEKGKEVEQQKDDEKKEEDEIGHDENQMEVVVGGEQGLDENHLLEIFKQTSMFSVKSVQANNEIMMGGENEFLEDDEFNASDFELDEDEFWGDDDSPRRRKRSGVPRMKRDSQSRKVISVLNRETGVYVQRKVRVVDESLPQLVKVPHYPVPLSWARTVTPYRPRSTRVSAPPDGCSVFHEPSIAEMNFKQLKKDKKYIGVLINPDWVDKTADSSKRRLSKLQKLPIRELCPHGFIFIWLDKVDVMPVCAHFRNMGYIYVENLTWVHLGVNNNTLLDESAYMRRSHLTLYIFRKANEGKDIELRHQRTPDVVCDCLQVSSGGHTKIPQEAYRSIETLLPDYHTRLLEFWSASDTLRPGWTQVVEDLSS